MCRTFYFRKWKKMFELDELTANEAQCLLSKDTHYAYSLKQLMLSTIWAWMQKEVGTKFFYLDGQ